MTASQLNVIFDKLNEDYSESGTLYMTDTWLDCDEIAHIIIGMDDNIYPDEHLQLYFDSTNELMLARTGKYKNGEWVSKIEPLSSTPLSAIVGIVTADRSHNKSPYKKGASV